MRGMYLIERQQNEGWSQVAKLDAEDRGDVWAEARRRAYAEMYEPAVDRVRIMVDRGSDYFTALRLVWKLTGGQMVIAESGKFAATREP